VSTIPKDILGTARASWPSAREEANTIHMAIARAILAERQRCAETTDKYRKDDMAGGEARLVAAYIHREIMSAA